MIIGVPREIKDNEFRVGLTPSGTETLTQSGHKVLFEPGAGVASGFDDEAYLQSGAQLVDATAAWRDADVVVKVKEPLDSEYKHLRPGLILFTYLHLAGVAGLSDELCRSGVTAIAYETVRLADGTYPLLTPMSEIAGKLAVNAGSHYLEHPSGGKGVLITGAPGVPPARVVVIGAGVVGQAAARLAASMGARVMLLNRSSGRLREFLSRNGHAVTTALAQPSIVADAVAAADIVVGAVYVGGERAATVVTRDMVRTMEPGSVIVDVAIDQGGCVETSRATNYSDPVYVEEGVVHYCVANMPGAVPRTSTVALTNETLPYLLKLADEGLEAAVRSNPALAQGVNVHSGDVTNVAVAQSLGTKYKPLSV